MITDQTKNDAENLHDAYIVGIVMGDKRSVRVLFQRPDRQAGAIELLNVERFCATDFREGNIILGVEFIEGFDIDRDVVASLYGFRDSSCDAVDSLLAVARERQVVVRIDPSYGCQAIGLCEIVNIVFD